MNLQALLPDVTAYVRQAEARGLADWPLPPDAHVEPLAQGEYNLNYRAISADGHADWVIRVNIGTQIDRDDQIAYEYRALRLLEDTGVTPRPHYCDDSRRFLEQGLLVMEYLPGGALDYARDYEAVARLFARIHSHPVPPERNALILEDRPLSMTYEECSRLLPVYLESDLADAGLRDYLREVLHWASEARHRETYFQRDPCRGIINTEVNSGNFIANRQRNTLHLVDWEKPLWGDPSQDLSHFCAPMTTLWKTEYRMSPETKAAFLRAYREATPDRHLADTIEERVRLRDPFNYLRGISWSAMAWIMYQTGEHAIRNEDTFRKVCSYLDLTFLREMFDPHLTREASR